MRFGEGKPNGECRAAPRRARDIDAAAEQFGQPAADRQAESRAPVASRIGGVYLDEVLEQAAKLAGSDSDPRVAHLDQHGTDAIFVERSRFDDDDAPFCELAGIAD